MKLVVIGVKNKELTFNVVKGLVNQGFDLQLVVVRSKKKSIIKIVLKYIRKLSISTLIKKINGRRVKLAFNIKSICSKKGIGYIEDVNINSDEVFKQIQNLNPDLIILAGSPIIKEKIFSLAKLYTINIHRSLLPKYAGLDAIFWALYHNEDKIGATVHTVVKGIDAGDIICQEERIVHDSDNVDSLTKWYVNSAPDLIIKALKLIQQPDHKFQKQDFSQRSYYSKPSKIQVQELNKRLSSKRNKL